MEAVVGYRLKPLSEGPRECVSTLSCTVKSLFGIVREIIHAICVRLTETKYRARLRAGDTTRTGCVSQDHRFILRTMTMASPNYSFAIGVYTAWLFVTFFVL